MDRRQSRGARSKQNSGNAHRSFGSRAILVAPAIPKEPPAAHRGHDTRPPLHVRAHRTPNIYEHKPRRHIGRRPRQMCTVGPGVAWASLPRTRGTTGPGLRSQSPVARTCPPDAVRRAGLCRVCRYMGTRGRRAQGSATLAQRGPTCLSLDSAADSPPSFRASVSLTKLPTPTATATATAAPHPLRRTSSVQAIESHAESRATVYVVCVSLRIASRQAGSNKVRETR